MSERHLGDIWEPSGRKLGPGKPRHALARKCAKFIVKTDINCRGATVSPRRDESRGHRLRCLPAKVE